MTRAELAKPVATRPVDPSKPLTGPFTFAGPAFTGERVANPLPVCRCGHSQAAHVDGKGRCQFGKGCDAHCRGFVAVEDPS